MSIIRELLSTIISIMILAFVGRAVISWLVVFGVRNELLARLNEMLFLVTEPIVAPLRRRIPPLGGTYDISPMVAIVLLILVQRLFVNRL